MMWPHGKTSVLLMVVPLTMGVVMLLWGSSSLSPPPSPPVPSNSTDTPGLFFASPSRGINDDPVKPAPVLSQGRVVHVVTVMCGGREEEGLVMLTSLLALSAAPLALHVFALRTQLATLTTTFDAWPQNIRSRVQVKLYDVIKPRQWQRPEWIEPSYLPCSVHRMYQPEQLPDVDAVIYLDSDLFLLAPVEDPWEMFSTFNSTQLIGAATNDNSRSGGWYPMSAKHPYVLPRGVNSGVLLLNLTRLRTSHWQEAVMGYSQNYQGKLHCGDQDLFNIYLHHRPEELKLLSCSANYFGKFCNNRIEDPTSVCRDAEQNGAYILHGIWQTLKDPRLGLKPFYDGFKRYQLGEDLSPMVQEMKDKMNTSLPCHAVVDVFFKRLTATVNKTRK